MLKVQGKISGINIWALGVGAGIASYPQIWALEDVVEGPSF